MTLGVDEHARPEFQFQQHTAGSTCLLVLDRWSSGRTQIRSMMYATYFRDDLLLSLTGKEEYKCVIKRSGVERLVSAVRCQRRYHKATDDEKLIYKMAANVMMTLFFLQRCNKAVRCQRYFSLNNVLILARLSSSSHEIPPIEQA